MRDAQIRNACAAAPQLARHVANSFNGLQRMWAPPILRGTLALKKKTWVRRIRTLWHAKVGEVAFILRKPAASTRGASTRSTCINMLNMLNMLNARSTHNVLSTRVLSFDGAPSKAQCIQFRTSRWGTQRGRTCRCLDFHGADVAASSMRLPGRLGGRGVREQQLCRYSRLRFDWSVRSQGVVVEAIEAYTIQ